MGIITNILETPIGTIVQRIMPLPNKVKACVIVDEDGTHNIYIDPSANVEKEFSHEYGHIINNDMYSNKPIELIEDYL